MTGNEVREFVAARIDRQLIIEPNLGEGGSPTRDIRTGTGDFVFKFSEIARGHSLAEGLKEFGAIGGSSIEQQAFTRLMVGVVIQREFVASI